MEREILFRGKRVDNGEWGEGYYIHQYGAHEIYGADTADFERVHIDPATVGQYTGLTDKNGARIFEGDILKNSNGHNCVIKHGAFWPDMFFTLAEEAGFFPTNLWGSYADFGHEKTCLTEAMSGIVVIGNIHDNPELLEAQT